MVTTIHDSSSGAGATGRHRHLVLLSMAVWTLFVVLVLWWLLRSGAQDTGPTAWVMQDPASAHQGFVERARDWFRLLHLNFQRIYPWILFGPYVIWLGLHFALEQGRRRVSLPVHVAACVGFAAASQAINARTNLMMADVVVIRTRQQSDPSQTEREVNAVEVKVATDPVDPRWPGQTAHRLFLGNVTEHVAGGQTPDKPGDPHGAGLTNILAELDHAIKPGPRGPGPLSFRPLSTLLDLFAYGALVGLAQSVHFYRRYRDREHRALSLESTLAKARLNALQAQLQPHFLFNTLNAIATLVRRDPKAAEATLLSLSDLLRLSLSQSGKQEIPLSAELQFLDRYLEIQQTRFGDRLRIEQDVETNTLDCLVPTLLLQPLVENAIRHGLEPSEDGGLIRITARRHEGCLALSVEDDGVGLSPATQAEPTTGIGLANLQARLEALYGKTQKLELAARPEGGVAVRLEIPCRPAPVPVAHPLLTDS